MIVYTTPRLRGPITFRLLSVTTNSPNDTTNSRNVTTGVKTTSSRTIEISKKEQRKTKKDANRDRFDPESVQLPFESEKFSLGWRKWVKHRKEIGHPLTPTATSQQLTKLSAMVEARAIAAIQHSVANGWQGLFEPKPHNDQRPRYDPLGRLLNDAAQRSRGGGRPMKAAANTRAGPPIKRSVPGLQITGTVVNFRLRRTYQRQRAQGARWIAPSTDPPTAEGLESH